MAPGTLQGEDSGPPGLFLRRLRLDTLRRGLRFPASQFPMGVTGVATPAGQGSGKMYRSRCSGPWAVSWHLVLMSPPDRPARTTLCFQCSLLRLFAHTSPLPSAAGRLLTQNVNPKYFSDFFLFPVIVNECFVLVKQILWRVKHQSPSEFSLTGPNTASAKGLVSICLCGCICLYTHKCTSANSLLFERSGSCAWGPVASLSPSSETLRPPSLVPLLFGKV